VERGIEVPAGETPSDSARIRDMLMRECERVGASLAPNKRLRRINVLSNHFSVDTGELTPTLKLRRAVISRKYAEQIERIYGESR
jgi:long-chain acyl-CoA synthetase